jgi:TPP-dependent pyruvate/acetoin dehydrogenase alpha subunit
MRSPSPEPEISKDQFITAYRWMLLARVVEEKLASLYRGGKIFGGVFLGRGQEAVSVALGMALKKGDLFAPLIRDQAGRMAFGEPLIDAARTYLGSRLGPMRGRDGNVHRGRPKEGQFAMISHLGAMLPVVAGALMAQRFKGITGCVGATCLGEGGTSTGAFHEAMNLAAVENLPLVLVVSNNQFAYSTPNSRQFACRNLADRAVGYGITGWKVDGTRLDECLEVIPSAVNEARRGGGPQLVVASLLRLCGHGEHDDAGYISEELKSSPVGSDCLQGAAQYLREELWATDEELAVWRQEAVREVEATIAKVQREPQPNPDDEDWCALATPQLRDGFLVEI